MARTASGPGCTMNVTFGATYAYIDGSYGEDGATWGCSADGGETFSWWTSQGVADHTAFSGYTLCDWADMTKENHTFILKNSPNGKSQVIVKSFNAGSISSDDLGITTEKVSFATTEQPSSSVVSSSAVSSGSSASTGTFGGTTSAATASTSAGSFASTSISNAQSSSLSTTISSTSSSSSSSDTTVSTSTVFVLIAAVVCGIVVMCLIAALCLRTKPQKGREANPVRLSKSKREALREKMKESTDEEDDDGGGALPAQTRRTGGLDIGKAGSWAEVGVTDG
ncbi:hypothetical protein JCM8547_001423 [Rhodosporidiobolus lusitaniae]